MHAAGYRGALSQHAPLFADISVDMSEEEMQIARSTPNYRFDVSTPIPPAQATTVQPAVESAAAAFVENLLTDRQQPVVMFALEWCEFCWAVRRMFGKYKIPYRSVDLDSVEFQQEELGGKIRTALTARTSVGTIPQIFVAGKFIGGATDVLQACKEGSLQALLTENQVQYDRSVRDDPSSFLPTWLHPR